MGDKGWKAREQSREEKAKKMDEKAKAKQEKNHKDSPL